MNIDTGTIVSVSEANQNFSRVTRIADSLGEAVIFKNNRPKYLLVDLEGPGLSGMAETEKLKSIAARILGNTGPAVPAGDNDR